MVDSSAYLCNMQTDTTLWLRLEAPVCSQTPRLHIMQCNEAAVQTASGSLLPRRLRILSIKSVSMAKAAVEN